MGDIIKKKTRWGWKVGSVVKSPAVASLGLESALQQPYNKLSMSQMTISHTSKGRDGEFLGFAGVHHNSENKSPIDFLNNAHPLWKK